MLPVMQQHAPRSHPSYARPASTCVGEHQHVSPHYVSMQELAGGTTDVEAAHAVAALTLDVDGYLARPCSADKFPWRNVEAMRGGFALGRTSRELARVFDISRQVQDVQPPPHAGSGQQVLVVCRRTGSGQRCLDVSTWGLVPSWTKDFKAMRKPISLRSEMADHSGMLSSALMSRRCVVPADVFYGRHVHAGRSGSYAVARVDGELLALAAVWEEWKSPENPVLRTFALLTTSASPDMGALHDRMPVVLERDGWSRWLGGSESDVRDLLRPAPDGTLRTWPCRCGGD